MSRRALLTLGLILLLQACGGDKMIIEKERTLAVVQPVKDSSHPQVSFDVVRQEVLNSYRELVKIIPLGQGTGAELRRLADLELEASIQKRLSIYPEVIAQGDQDSFHAILHYNQYLKHYPDNPDNDQVLYQLARAYSLDANTYGAAPIMDRLVREFPQSEFIDEIQFRRGEHLFVDADYEHAAEAYADIVNNHPRSIYFEKALYKLGWSHLKLMAYEPALENFMQMLNDRYKRRQVREFELSLDINPLERELIDDVIRASAICFSYLPGKDPIGHFFSSRRAPGFTPLLYSRLGQTYIEKQRTLDAADIFIAFGERHPLSPYAPTLHDRAISVIAEAGFIGDLLQQKLNFIERFNQRSEFWAKLGSRDRIKLQPILTRHMFDVATHYHAQARDSKARPDYQRAAGSYRVMLDDFPKDPKAHHINYLLAEALIDAGNLQQAIVEYNKTAYDYAPHSNSAEAAYSAITAYRDLRVASKDEQATHIDEQIIQASIRFHDHFTGDQRAALVLLKSIEMLYDQARYEPALNETVKLVDNETAERDTRQHARIIRAHSLFRLARFGEAEEAYESALDKALPNEKQQSLSMRENLALAIYRQAEQARAAGKHVTAADHFKRVGEKVPESPTRIIAQYDAATEYVVLRDWGSAIALLEDFRQRYPDQDKWRRGVSEKLALAYSSLGQHARAAEELLNQGQQLQGEERSQTLISAAELFEKANQPSRAIDVYSDWIKTYPTNYPRVVEYSNRIASFYESRADKANHQTWLKKVVELDARAGEARSDATRYLAALAALTLASSEYRNFVDAQLTVPLDSSLKRKKQLMQAVLQAYSDAARYQVSEVTTSATYHIGEIYRGFARALLQSERPPELNAEELEEYNYLLEEQAYPFEEKAISIHEKNIDRIAASGAWDASIQGSLKALGDLLPYRYAKNEIVEEFNDVLR